MESKRSQKGNTCDFSCPLRSYINIPIFPSEKIDFNPKTPKKKKLIQQVKLADRSSRQRKFSKKLSESQSERLFHRIKSKKNQIEHTTTILNIGQQVISGTTYIRNTKFSNHSLGNVGRVESKDKFVIQKEKKINLKKALGGLRSKYRKLKKKLQISEMVIGNQQMLIEKLKNKYESQTPGRKRLNFFKNNI